MFRALSNHCIQLIVIFTLFVAVLTWLERLGGLGLILMGVADNSVVLPGSMDAMTLFLSAHRPNWWPYYATTATIGAVVGGYVTYTVGRKGGKETLMRRLSQRRRWEDLPWVRQKRIVESVHPR